MLCPTGKDTEAAQRLHRKTVIFPATEEVFCKLHKCEAATIGERHRNAHKNSTSLAQEHLSMTMEADMTRKRKCGHEGREPRHVNGEEIYGGLNNTLRSGWECIEAAQRGANSCITMSAHMDAEGKRS